MSLLKQKNKKVIMTMVVRNEEDIIRYNILFHRACGVDFFIVIDHMSTDKTTEILKSFEQKGYLHYIYKADPEMNQSEWVTFMAQLAKTKYKADWVINNDADEFWFPKSGDFNTELNKFKNRFNIIPVKRHNFILPKKVSGKFYKHMVYKDIYSKNPSGGPLYSKIIHKASSKVLVCEGGHSVKRLNNPIITRILLKLGIISYPSIDIETFHFPYRSTEQIIEKLINQNQRFRRIPEIGDILLDMKKKDLQEYAGLKSFLNHTLLNESQIKDRIASGKLVVDTRLRDFFKRNNIE